MSYEINILNIIDFLRNHDSLITQNTLKWKQNRKFIVGSSEISALLGENFFKSRWQLMEEKIYSKPYTFQLPCSWGKMFEPVMEIITELEYGTEIFGNNSCIFGEQFGYPGIINSPDGYCVLKFFYHPITEKYVLPTRTFLQEVDSDDFVFAPVVLEFKSPFSRDITKKPPKYYLPQIWTGITLCPLVLCGLFIEGVFRLCEEADWHNTNYMNIQRDKEPFLNVIGRGYFYVYSSDTEIDLNDLNESSLSDLMQKSKIKLGYFKLNDVDDEFHRAPRDGNMKGKLFFKLYKINFLPIAPNSGYLSSIQPEITRFIEEVQERTNTVNPLQPNAQLSQHR
uniref:Protein D345L n=1 Tax=Abalone asfa-like virus TaxID=2839893 RepID=A0A5K7XX21_9VIRU|nr:D345L homolog protein [Abalone asfa-like virus]BCY04627.1 hypothetical protein [Abalone asfa-like virus]